MNDEISFKEVIDLTKKIISRFEKIEGKSWGIDGSMIELSKQVGDLSQLVMVSEKYYFPNRHEANKQYESNNSKIADELSDILMAVTRIAEYYNIDLVEAHIEAINRADKFLESKGV